MKYISFCLSCRNGSEVEHMSSGANVAGSIPTAEKTLKMVVIFLTRVLRPIRRCRYWRIGWVHPMVRLDSHKKVGERGVGS